MPLHLGPRWHREDRLVRHHNSLLHEVLHPMTLCVKMVQRNLPALRNHQNHDRHRAAASELLRRGYFLEDMWEVVPQNWRVLPVVILLEKGSCGWKDQLAGLWQSCYHRYGRKKMVLLEARSLYLHAAQSEDSLYGVVGSTLVRVPGCSLGLSREVAPGRAILELKQVL